MSKSTSVERTGGVRSFAPEQLPFRPGIWKGLCFASPATKRFTLLWFVALFFIAQAASARVIGVDAVHGWDIDAILASGSEFSQFRSTITGLGDTIVPVYSFLPSNLSGLDGLIVKIPYTQNLHPYNSDEMNAIRAFAQRAVFVSDSSLWGDPGVAGSDRPINFGDNALLLRNTINFIGSNGVLFVGDDGSGFDIGNFNTLVSPFGISFSSAPMDPAGRTVTGFVPHTVTAGLNSVGVDYQIPITSQFPSLDLTIGGGGDNVLAVYPVPEPSSVALGSLSLVMMMVARNHSLRRRLSLNSN